MKDNIIKSYLSKLSDANSNEEIDKILDEVIPKLKANGISLPQVMMYFKMYGDDAIPKSQDHRNSISNSNKAQIVLQKLLAKLKN
ncbi:hypothetical protein IMCC3317_39360 [Kordia antarctica]|uniref:Uncharacterized protein n=1 Tax=Kordia antarctica TaxID=1218801 RepID=A0A7L4ZPA4_9FLAO|nr:hypothetical protein [Kordia antarctica]QHI38543.1 hypothetical protein IMCC3317_39360 [Kordia antarctica]